MGSSGLLTGILFFFFFFLIIHFLTVFTNSFTSKMLTWVSEYLLWYNSTTLVFEALKIKNKAKSNNYKYKGKTSFLINCWRTIYFFQNLDNYL